MMFKLAFLGIVLVGVCHALTDSEVMDQWKKFQLDHQKSYKSPVEATKRLRIFRENLEQIEEHNARYRNGEETYEQGVNQFTDWTEEEFNEYVDEIRPVFDTSNSLGVFVGDPNFTAPASIDWRDQGVVATPQNQGECGSCWTFSATGALEGQMAIRDKKLTELSKQNLLDCAKTPKYRVYGCRGGLMNIAFDYVKDSGIETQSAYPAYDGDDTHPCRQQSKDLEISGHKMVEAKESALEEAVATVGPVSIAFNAIKSFSHYHAGIYSEPECNKNEANHAVLAVGYGEERGVQYWIVKNSWGAHWGEQGYFRLKKGVNQCRLEHPWNTYPVL